MTLERRLTAFLVSPERHRHLAALEYYNIITDKQPDVVGNVCAALEALLVDEFNQMEVVKCGGLWMLLDLSKQRAAPATACT